MAGENEKEELTQEEKDQKEYDKSFAEPLPGEEEEAEEAGEVKGKTDEEEPPEGEPAQGGETPPVSKKYGSVESMEKSVADSKRAMTDAIAERNDLKGKNDDLQQKLADFESGKATQAEVEEAKRGVDEAKTSLREKMKVAGEEYPELKETFDALANSQESLSDANRTLTEQVEELTKENDEGKKKTALIEAKGAFERDVLPTVLEKHPNAKELFNESKEYWEWVDTLSPAMRFAAERSTDPQDIISILDAYKRHVGSDEEQEKKEEKERQNQSDLNNAQTLRGGSGTSMPTKLPGEKDKQDYEAGWDESGEILEKQGVG